MKYEQEQEIYAGQVRRVYLQHSVGLIANVVVSSILVFIQWQVIPHPVLLTWYSALILATLVKYLLLYRYRHSIVTPAQSTRWGAWFIAGVLLTGLIWGSAGIFLFAPASLANQIFIAFVLAGMVAGAVGTYSALEKAFLAFGIPALAPLIIKFFSLGGEIHLAMGLMTLLFATLMIVTSRRSHKTILTSLKLLSENRNLIEYLTESKERAEALNIKLEAEVAKKKKAETELKRHQEQLELLVEERTAELKNSEEKYRILVNHANDAIFILQDERVKFPNPRFTAITGYSAEDVAAIPFYKMVHPDEREVIKDRYQKRIKGEDVPDLYSFRFITKSGEERYTDVNAVRISWEGRPAAMYLCRDVTEKIKLQDKLQMIQKLEAIGILAGGIAHDFNNLLTAIMGNISLTRLKLPPDNPGFKLLEEAEKACLLSKNLTQQLLTFSRGGAPVKKVIRLPELIQQAAKFSLRGANVTCAFNFAPDLWPVNADAGQISQVFNNLIINADQAMPEGGRIEIKGENFAVKPQDQLPLPEGRYIKISVNDQGEGIPKKDLSRIFDPFFSTKKEGSGLGLATSYSIVDKHAGYIRTESKPGKGARLVVYLPAARAEPVDPPSPPPDRASGEGRILVMDDEVAVAQVTCLMLENFGYRTEIVPDGEAAIAVYSQAILEGRPFAAVIMDLTIPGGMGGRETLERLRKKYPAVKAIVASGYSNDPIMAEYQRYGFAGVLIKPYDMATLNQVLRKILIKAK